MKKRWGSQIITAARRHETATAPRGSDHRPPKHALRTPELAMLAAIRRTDLFAP